MKRLLTDTELRAVWFPGREKAYYVEEGTLLTPSAKDFIREHGITLCHFSPANPPAAMSRTPIPTRNGKAVYVDVRTGETLEEKPEELTHLRGNQLVPKTHPRITFRGRLDSLIAQIMEVQLEAHENGETQIEKDLEELAAYTRTILGAEVKEEPLTEVCLLGMDSESLRSASHHVKKTLGIEHPVPNYTMGRMCVALNRLRTQVREVELAAARAFEEDGVFQRVDIIEGLNRMSSCVYLIFCRKLSGYYDRGSGHP